LESTSILMLMRERTKGVKHDEKINLTTVSKLWMSSRQAFLRVHVLQIVFVMNEFVLIVVDIDRSASVLITEAHVQIHVS
jgi:hypothetical protein